MGKPTTVVETPVYLASTKKLLTKAQRDDLVSFLAYNRKAGALISGTGGLRKLRWALPGEGKSGGVRVIHFYHDESMPLFLITAYGKTDKDNLDDSEKNAFRKLTRTLVETYRKQKR